ncbi:CG31248 [Drosophila busckii]|uniref:CG31248 n=1 Tax=Drosophila busckii TaxID=30019 RepID=A0A0M3QXX1_DROBS|nr:uncharacterized protein LOC108602479 [Drosophila busckii]ALC46663.1 CG31248 [Drosophila busckii]
MRAEHGKLWSTLLEGKYELRSLSEADLEEALDVNDAAFFAHESVCIGCEINLPENEQARKELRQLCVITAQDGVSLFIRHVESGRIVSVAFNKLQFAPPNGEEPFFVKFRNEHVKSPQAQALMNYMINMDTRIDVCAMYNIDCVLELMYLGTLPEFGCLGLGRALTEYTVKLAKEFAQGKNLEDVPKELHDKRPAAVTALWTSIYTQKIGKSLNFKVLNTVPFTEFKFDGKGFDERIGELHKFSELVVYKL